MTSSRRWRSLQHLVHDHGWHGSCCVQPTTTIKPSTKSRRLTASRWILLWVIENFLTEHDDYFLNGWTFYNLHFFSIGTHFWNGWTFFKLVNIFCVMNIFLMHEDFDSANISAMSELFLKFMIIFYFHEHCLKMMNMFWNRRFFNS